MGKLKLNNVNEMVPIHPGISRQTQLPLSSLVIATSLATLSVLLIIIGTRALGQGRLLIVTPSSSSSHKVVNQ